MKPKANRHRGIRLSDHARDTLRQWVETRGVHEVARTLGVRTKTIDRWLGRGPVDGTRLPGVLDSLQRFAKSSFATSATSPDPPSQSSEAEIEGHFTRGCRLHFQLFQPQAAMEELNRLVFHPRLGDVPPLIMLDRMMVVMAIFRQSLFAGEGDILACGRQCVKRVACLNLLDHGEPLAASLCAVAWELVAVTIQRGHAIAGVTLLEQVTRNLDLRKLWCWLPPGRERIIRRMVHWGNVVAHDNFDYARRYIQSRGSPINAELGANSIHVGPEIANTLVQQLSERLRFSMTQNSLKCTNSVIEFFDGSIHPLLDDLARSTSSAKSGAQKDSLASLITPSTALGTAFQAFVTAIHTQHPKSKEIIESSVEVATRVQKTSRGSIMLPRFNPETTKLLRQLKSANAPTTALLSTFTFVNDLTANGVKELHDMAILLLGYVDQCFPSMVSMPRTTAK